MKHQLKILLTMLALFASASVVIVGILYGLAHAIMRAVHDLNIPAELLLVCLVVSPLLWWVYAVAAELVDKKGDE